MELNGNYRRLYACLNFTAILLAGLLCAGIVRAQGSDNPSSAATQDEPNPNSKKSEQLMVKLKILVKGKNDKPIANASVYVRYNLPDGIFHKNRQAELDLKTSNEGTVKVPPVPQGKILIQVIAPGWHTYGKWYDIEKDEDSVEITLDSPTHWY